METNIPEAEIIDTEIVNAEAEAIEEAKQEFMSAEEA